MKRWWIMPFILPLPMLLAGIVSLTFESFIVSGITNLTIAVMFLIGYIMCVVIAFTNYN